MDVLINSVLSDEERPNESSKISVKALKPRNSVVKQFYTRVKNLFDVQLIINESLQLGYIHLTFSCRK